MCFLRFFFDRKSLQYQIKCLSLTIETYKLIKNKEDYLWQTREH